MSLVARLYQLALSLARELSDENAYQRHLRRSGRCHSGAEWRAFTDGRQARKYKNPKCC